MEQIKMTKWFDSHNNMWVDRDTPIVLPYNNTLEDKTFYCKYCRRVLMQISADEFHCTTCNIQFFPELQDVRSKSKVDEPAGPNTDNPLVSYPPDPNAPFYEKHKPKYEGGIKVLSQRGTIKILDYKDSSKGKFRVQTYGRKRNEEKESE
jgi:hypothetical protein